MTVEAKTDQLPEPFVSSMQHINVDIGETYSLDNAHYYSSHANDLEELAWQNAGFGSAEANRKYDSQSRLIVATSNDSGEIVGSTRIFGGGEQGLPFIEAMPMLFEPEIKEELYRLVEEGAIEEFGTVAVHPTDATRFLTFLNMQRIAYRDARQRGVRYWGAIMEPERIERMNKQYGFTFAQLGPTIDYQGGQCAAHIMDLNEVHETMERENPVLFDWFVSKEL